MEKNEIIICECNSPEHQYLFRYDDGDLNEYACVYVSPYLSSGNFWHRLKYGIKYIFGYKSKYGAFDEFVFKPEDVNKLVSIVKYLNKVRIKHDPDKRYLVKDKYIEE